MEETNNSLDQTEIDQSLNTDHKKDEGIPSWDSDDPNTGEEIDFDYEETEEIDGYKESPDQEDVGYKKQEDETEKNTQREKTNRVLKFSEYFTDN